MKKFRILILLFSMLLSIVLIGCPPSGGGDDDDDDLNNGSSGSESIVITNISPIEGTVIDRGSDDRNDVDFSVTVQWSFEGSMAEITGAWVWADGSYTPVCHDVSGKDYWDPTDCFDDILVSKNSGTMTYSWTNHNWIGYPTPMTFRIYMWTANGLSTDSAIYY